MTGLAEMTHECEVCGVELPRHGGPYRSRWCAEHRAEGKRVAAAVKAREYRRRAAVGLGPHLKCEGCGAWLLEPSADDLCGFCRVERL